MGTGPAKTLAEVLGTIPDPAKLADALPAAHISVGRYFEPVLHGDKALNNPMDLTRVTVNRIHNRRDDGTRSGLRTPK
jgi:hypothetical protein